MSHTSSHPGALVRVRSAKKTDKRSICLLINAISQFTLTEKKLAHTLVHLALKDSKRHGYAVLVATIDNAIVGYVCFGNTPLTKTTYDLYWLAVHPSYQGQGIARALITRLITVLKKKNILVLRAETSGTPHYRATRKFYEKVGFQKVGSIKHFYSKGDDLMTYILNTK